MNQPRTYAYSHAYAHTCRDAVQVTESPTPKDVKGWLTAPQLTLLLVSVTLTVFNVTVPVLLTVITYSTVSPASGQPFESESDHSPVSSATTNINNDENGWSAQHYPIVLHMGISESAFGFRESSEPCLRRQHAENSQPYISQRGVSNR